MADQKTSHAAVTALMKTYYDKRLIERLMPKTRLYQLGEKRPIPAGSGKTIEFTGYRNIYPIFSNSDELSSAQTYISAYTITATLIQRHNYVKLSTLLKQTSIDPRVEGAVDVLADQAARTVELYLRNAIVGGLRDDHRSSIWNLSINNNSTYVSKQGTITLSKSSWKDYDFRSDYPVLSNGARLATSASFTNVSGGFAGTAMSVNEIRYGVSYLKARDVEPPDGSDSYVLYTHPFVVDILMQDPKWQSWNSPQNALKTMYRGEVGNVMGTRIIQSSMAYRAVFSGAPSLTASGAVNASFLVGKGAFGVSEINGGKGKRGFEIIVKAPGPDTTSDPANLFSTVANKMVMAACVLNKSAGAILLTTDRAVSSAS